jgi:hypothetical protein
MKRIAFLAVVLLSCLSFIPAAFAQTKAPASTTKKDATPATNTAPAPVSEELMKARMKPPYKGTATVDYIQGPSKPIKDEIVTVLKVKNTSGAPIIGFRIDQYFYNGKDEISAGTGRVRNPIAADEIVEITVTAPMKPNITGSQMRFSHANGSVKPTAVKSFDAAGKKSAAAKK